MNQEQKDRAAARIAEVIQEDEVVWEQAALATISCYSQERYDAYNSGEVCDPELDHYYLRQYYLAAVILSMHATKILTKELERVSNLPLRESKNEDDHS